MQKTEKKNIKEACSDGIPYPDRGAPANMSHCLVFAI
jgi:hypothetical protein